MAALPTIRPVERTDFDEWLRLWDGYNSFYGRSGATALPAEVSRTTWERFFDPREPVQALVADGQTRLVGLAHCIFHRSTIMIGPTCYLQDLFTVNEERGRGVGRALIEAVYAEAEKAGASRVYWLTQEDNAAARRLYDDVATYAGFIQYRKQIGG